jgi:hypothetical protein
LLCDRNFETGKSFQSSIHISLEQQHHNAYRRTEELMKRQISEKDPQFQELSAIQVPNLGSGLSAKLGNHQVNPKQIKQGQTDEIGQARSKDSQTLQR